MTHFYIAAPWSEREEARKVARGIELTTGLTCCAGWLDESFDGKPNYDDLAPTYLSQCCVRDIEDVNQADIFIALCDGDDKRHGGRHVELGAAIVLQKRIILVGEPEHLFHHHPLVVTIPNRANIRQAIERLLRGVNLGDGKQ